MDKGRMPLPTRPQRYCDPASLVINILVQTEKARHDLEERMLRTQADHEIMGKKLATADFSRVESLEKNLKDAVKQRDSIEIKLKEVWRIVDYRDCRAAV